MDKDGTKDEYKGSFALRLSFIGSLGGFLFGYDTGIISGAQLYFYETWPDITTSQIEWVVSIALFAAFVGSLIAGPLSDRYGRKPVILGADVMFVGGTLVIALATSIVHLLIGRLVVGLAIGISSMVVPVYLSEIAPIKIRGKVVAIFVSVICCSQVLASLLAFTLKGQWRIMIVIGAFPAVLQLLLMLKMPET